MISPDNAVLIIIDVQGNLAGMVQEHEHLFSTVERTIQAAQALTIPILWTEQVPEKLGDTVETVRRHLFPILKPISKKSFSCYDCPEFLEELRKTGRQHVIVTGIETHVCVYQTARDLHRHGYEVHLVADAVSSRHQTDKLLAIERMRQEGITITSAEMLICELTRTSAHPHFKSIVGLLKK